MSTVEVFVHAESTRHKNGYGHPEAPERIEAIKDLFVKRSFPEIVQPALELQRKVMPELIHTEEYLSSLERTLSGAAGIMQLDPDTYAGSESLTVALEGLSLQEQAVEAIFSRRNPTFVFSRPPGHHARPNAAMGFCLLANAAYAARYAQKSFGVKRVAIVDWDVHQGNGTEEIFLEDPSVYTISLHAYPYWPYGYGDPNYRGKGEGKGYNLNLPLPMEAGDWQYIQYFENFVVPTLFSFKPEFIIVAAGFDAHKEERNSRTTEKSSMALSENGYSYMTHALHAFAKQHCGGRIHFTLEGGYYIPSLCSSIASVVETLSQEKVLSSPGFTSGDGMKEEEFAYYTEQIDAVLTPQ